MYQTAGDKYVASNKFNTLYWSIAMIVAFLIAIGIGRLYALISIINPLIYLNFLVLAGAAIATGIIITLTRSIGKSRNHILNVVTSIVICYTAWAAHWAHIMGAEGRYDFWPSLFSFTDHISYTLDFASNRNLAVGRIGSSGVGIDPSILFLCYIVEFAAFMAPVYLFLRSKEYYCEACDTDYTTITGYIKEDEILRQHTTEILQGDLTFLKNNIIYPALNALPLDAKEKPNIGAVELHYCRKCYSNAIVNLKAGVLKQDEKKRRDIANIDKLMEDTYITDESRQLLSAKLGLA
jgi:hypothetical protein